MPDIANAQKFIKKLTAVEQDYLRQIDGYRTQARRVMLEILDREGVTRQAVAKMRREVDSLKEQVTALGRSTSKDIRRTVQNYTRKQIQLANKAGLTNENDIGALVAKGTDNAKDGEETFMTSTPGWLAQLETSLQTTSAQLRISQALPEEVSARLLSERLADGRASVWAASGNAAALEETRDVWTYAVGLAGAYLFFFNQEEEFDYQKQAIATIDERTTDCCLRVHGQIQPIDEPFQLTGTPRYADEIQDPPFHWYAIVAGEMCVTDKGYVPIEDIRVGDMVLTHKGRYKPVTMTLARVYTGNGLLIETTGGEIKITLEHPVLTARGWIKAGGLLIGDVILGCDVVHDGTSARTKSINMPWVEFGAHNLDAASGKKSVADLVFVSPRAMTSAVDFNREVETRKEEVDNIPLALDGFLKLEVDPIAQAFGFEPLQESCFDGSRVGTIGSGGGDSHFLSYARHAGWVVGLHPSGCSRVGNPNAGMGKSLPLSFSGFKQVSPRDPRFNQSLLDNIPGNPELLRDGVFRHPAFIETYDLVGINIHSSRHSNLRTEHYTIKCISTLELLNSVICDLSVQDDESYCIAGHYVHNCRTSEALYHESFEQIGVPTEKMRDMADLELDARELTGRRITITPSHAASRREGALPSG